MELKFLNTLNGHYQMKKRLYIVYKTYNYLGEIFYCVKTRKFNHEKYEEKPKYTYIEKRTGARVIIPFAKNKILTKKAFKRFLKKQVGISRKYKKGNNIRQFLDNAIKHIEEFKEKKRGD